MGKNLDDIIKSLPVDRQEKIVNVARIKVEEMIAHTIAHSTTLTNFRMSVGEIQTEAIKELGIN
jgi:hypothetical protein